MAIGSSGTTGGAGAAGQGSCRPGPGVIENFHRASGQEPGELCLAVGQEVISDVIIGGQLVHSNRGLS